MGNKESSPPRANPSTTDNIEPSNDDIPTRIGLEIQDTLNHLQSLRFRMTEDAYHAQKKKVEELKLKFVEFYKFTQINDDMIKRLSTEKTNLKAALNQSHSVLNEYKSELTKCAQEKENINETYKQKEQELNKKVSQLQLNLCNESEARVKDARDVIIYNTKCESLKVEIRKLQNNLETAKSEVQLHQQQKADLKFQKQLNQQKNEELTKKLSQLQFDLSKENDARKKIQQDMIIYKNQCESREIEIKKLQNNLQTERCLYQKQKAELQKKHEEYISYPLHQNLQGLVRDLGESQRILARERALNIEQEEKLRFAKQQGQQDKDIIIRLKAENEQLQNQLIKTKNNLGKSRKDVREIEVIKKNMVTDLKNKQEKIDDYVKQLEIKQWEIERLAGEKPTEQECETKLNRLCGDFVSVCKNNINENSFPETIRKYEEIITDLKSELKLSDKKFQSEERVKKELQGKLFLLEKSFNSLKGLCNKEIRDLKRLVNNKEAKEDGGENKLPKRSTEKSSISENKPIEANQASPSDENQQDNKMLKKEFCADQKEEMAELQKELETIFTAI